MGWARFERVGVCGARGLLRSTPFHFEWGDDFSFPPIFSVLAHLMLLIFTYCTGVYFLANIPRNGVLSDLK